MTSPPIIAGHPIAIRVGGRRMSQSSSHPTKSSSGMKGPSPSTSPEDGADDLGSRTPADYPRPNGPGAGEQLNEDEANKEENHHRKEKEQQRKKGMSAEESKYKRLESGTGGGSKGAPGRKMSGAGAGIRITQPAGKMI
ncbi:hypothetical protein IE53DRAFT_75548 [Violaceomyces palustris]|uniref:Uncharacterized protein n=1 Tax=Violaceomyces palustris TaxID=1673888 RepID=A0ACD0NYM7_9BASI|nr:hypothetical protein IE53DRAFT_75548 [Violaceomyces palustris]